jgi:hypothetical protein
MNSRGRTGGHLPAVCADGEQDCPVFVIDASVDAEVVVARVDSGEKSIWLQRGGEGQFDLSGGLSDETISVSHLREVLDDQYLHPGRGGLHPINDVGYAVQPSDGGAIGDLELQTALVVIDRDLSLARPSDRGVD